MIPDTSASLAVLQVLRDSDGWSVGELAASILGIRYLEVPPSAREFISDAIDQLARGGSDPWLGDDCQLVHVTDLGKPSGARWSITAQGIKWIDGNTSILRPTLIIDVRTVYRNIRDRKAAHDPHAACFAAAAAATAEPQPIMFTPHTPKEPQ